MPASTSARTVSWFDETGPLVPLDEGRVADRRLEAALRALGLGDEQVVAGRRHAAAELARELRPRLPVVLGRTVLDRHDRIAADEVRPEGRQLVRAEHAALE